MQIEVEPNCPLDKNEHGEFNPCRKTKCAWFTQVRGKNPNTGADIDEWGCAVAWLPLMLIENAQQQKHAGAAVESFRNEVVRQTDKFMHATQLQLGAPD